MLAETATTEISQKRQPEGFKQSKPIAKDGGVVTGTLGANRIKNR